MLFPEYVEMLSILYEEKVEFVIVGGYAFGVHHEPRATKDLDIFVRSTRANAARLIRALGRFGAPLFDLAAVDLAAPGIGLQIGIAPRRIDVLTEIDGVAFREAWASRKHVKVAGLSFPLAVIGRAAYIKNKRAIVAKDQEGRRPQDRADLALLTSKPPPRRTRRSKK